MMEFLGSGGVGSVLNNFNSAIFDFGLKIVVRPCSRSENIMFWKGARSIQTWTGNIRFQSQCVKVPLAQQYWVKASDCRNAKNLQHLSELIQHHGKLGDIPKCPEILKDIDPAEYVLCPEELLREIYRNDCIGRIISCRLLITYPVQLGGSSAASCIAGKMDFSDQELLSCCYQLLSVIDYFYERKCAHRDIKPGNILVDENCDGKKVFRLIDFDAFHSPEHTSTAGSAAFLPADFIVEELKKKYQPLEFRVLLDCFALAQSIVCMRAKSQHDTAEFIFDIPPLVRKLYCISKFKPSDIKPLLAELEKLCGGVQKLPYKTAEWYCDCQFDSFEECCLGEIGTFHEQIHFSEKNDLLLKTERCGNSLHEVLPFIHCPILHDNCSTYFHAPDNVGAGGLWKYEPRIFQFWNLSQQERELLFSYGKQLNEYYSRADEDVCAYHLKKEHIIWCDGEIKIIWGLGEKLEKPVDYEKYFRWLVGRNIEFSYQDWKTLLPHETGLSYDASPEYWQRLMDEVVADFSVWSGYARMGKNYSWLYEIREFREFVVSHAQKLSENGVLCFLPEIPGLADNLTGSTWWMLLKKAVSDSRYDWIIKLQPFREFAMQNAEELSTQEWLCLLQKIPDLEKKLTVRVCRQLLKEFAQNIKYDWLFDKAVFRKKIAREKLEFSTAHWLAIRKYTHEFDCRCSPESGGGIFKHGSCEQRKSLLESPAGTAIYSWLQQTPKELFKVFFLYKKYDEEKFTEFFPENVRAGFTSRQWGKFIAANPRLVKFMPERVFPYLARRVWVRLLGFAPELMEKCSCRQDFNSAQWCSIILQQAALKEYLPPDITFSKNEENRLREKIRKN